jgi:hypothetical protein
MKKLAKGRSGFRPTEASKAQVGGVTLTPT